MDIIIHDSKLKKVAYIDNELQDTLSFYDDKWSRYLDTASSTFEFTVYKKGIKSDSVKEKAYQTLTERSFVSFKYNKRTYLFNVMRTEETETTIRCYCENLNLELLNEMAGPFKATTEMSFVDYCNKFFLLVGGAITVGHNEIEDRERTLEWTGTDTKLKRLLSIANQFDAEIEFETVLDEDSSLKSFILHVYKENDDKNQGVGRKRDDVVLRYGHNVEGVTRTIDKTGIFNMITPIGKATVDVTTTKANPKYVAPQLGTVNYNGGSLSNAGRTINKDLVNEILNLCVQHKLLPSGVFSQLYLESWWGNSPVARADNNWGGLTWTGSTTRPSGVTVTQGTARPANEGGYYMHFANLTDYFKDYTYLLAEQGIYKVKGANSIDSYTKGLFRVGGATYDYAASGYDHYAPLMRSIRNGINSASNGAMDTLDAQLKSAGTVGTAPVSQIASKTKSTLDALTAKKNTRIGSGQCYALSAWYAYTIGGPWLGGGVTNGFKGLYPGGGSAAARIGEDYNWSQFGWKMVRPSQVSHLIPGSIANIKANFNGGFLNTTGLGHTVVIKAISGDTLTVLEQNFAGHQYVEERTYSASQYLGAIQTLCYPPEIVQGKRIDGTESAPAQSGNNEPATISETQQKEVITTIPTDLYREWKNEDGIVEFYLKNGSIYAPISKNLYPSAFSGEEVSDNWIKKSIEYNTIDIEKLISYSIEEIKKNCYPSISYEVKGTDESLDMGDTVKIDDEEFPDGLVLSARVSEQHISFTNPNSNQTVFDNYKALKNKLSKDLIDRYEELAEQAKPYELRLLTDKGTQFKNSTGLSVLTAELWKSNKKFDATFQFRNFDTLLASGLSYTADGSTIPIDKPFLVSVDAFIGNDLVATRQITFTNVSDGADGVGVNSVSITYGLSKSASTQPTTWTTDLPVAGQGDYLWTRKITDYTDSTKEDTIELTYSFQGKDGVAGASLKVSKIEYQAGTSGTIAPTGTWTTTIPSVPEGQYLWSKTTLSDNSIVYGIAKQGATGPKGDKGDPGNGINSVSVMFGVSTSSTIQPSTWSETMPAVTQSQYLWKRRITDYTDSAMPDTVEYSYTYQGKDGQAGTSLTVKKIEYQTGTSATVAPTGTWSTSIVTAPDGQYLWMRVTMSDNSTLVVPTKQGSKGSDGITYYPHTAYANKSKDIFYDSLPSFANSPGYQGALVSSVPENGAYKITTTGGTHVMKTYVGINGTSGKDLWTIVRLKNIHSTNNLKLVFNGIGDGTVLNGSFPTIVIKPDEEYFFMKSGVARSNYDFIQITFQSDSADKDLAFTLYEASFYNSSPFVNFSFVPNNHDFLGYYTDTSVNASTDITKYNWNKTKGALDEAQVAEMNSKIDSKADQALTQEQLNLLLETQNLMTAEMRTKATAEQVDALIASYNKYVSDEAVNKANVEAELIANAERIEAFRKDYDDKMLQLDFVSNYMRATDLGLEVSASDGSSSLLVQKDRISMFSAGKEVMYISQGFIHIDNGVFTKTLQIGNFRESQLDGDQTTNVTIYVG